MIGRFNDPVIHLPTGRKGHIVMHPSGSSAIMFTAVQLDTGEIAEFPDAELRVVGANGSMNVTAIRFASSRPFPDDMIVQLRNNGDGTVNVSGQIPGSPLVTFHSLPLQNGEVVLPDEYFPIRS